MLAYAPRPRAAFSPRSLAIVIGLHAALLAAVLMAKSQLIVPVKPPPTTLIEIDEIDPPPPPEPVEPKQAEPEPAVENPYTVPEPVVEPPKVPVRSAPELVAPGPVRIDPGPPPRIPADAGPGGSGSGGAGLAPVAPTGATLLTSGEALRPPYPLSKQRSDEEATLRLRLSIDARGRVTDVEAIGAADRTFLRAAERHLKRVWRYKPATREGRPIASTKVVTLTFELQ